MIRTTLRQLATIVHDSWVNTTTGLGVTGKDTLTDTRINYIRHFGREELERMYHGSHLFAAVFDIPSSAMVREWFRYSGDLEGEHGDLILRRMSDFGLERILRSCLTWASLFGGSGLFLEYIDGSHNQRGGQAEPLDPRRVKSIGRHMVLDRWSLHPEERDEWGNVTMYRVNSAHAAGMTDHPIGEDPLVHASRIIRFDSPVDTTHRQRVNNNGWNLTIMPRLYELAQGFATALNAAFQLGSRPQQDVLAVEDLNQMLNQDRGDTMRTRMELIEFTRSILGWIPIEKGKEEFVSVAANVQGLNELYEFYMANISMAADIPQTRLFGRAPQGENATGEHDEHNWNASVHYRQKTELTSPLRLLTELFSYDIGRPVSREGNWDVVYNSLRLEPTELERSQIVANRIKAISEAQLHGNITNEDAERRSSRILDGMHT